MLCQGHEPFVFIPCTRDDHSVFVVGDRETCVCVSERRKERSDKGTQRGVGPRMARRRKRYREKRGRTKDGSVDGKM